MPVICTLSFRLPLLRVYFLVAGGAYLTFTPGAGAAAEMVPACVAGCLGVSGTTTSSNSSCETALMVNESVRLVSMMRQAQRYSAEREETHKHQWRNRE